MNTLPLVPQLLRRFLSQSCLRGFTLAAMLLLVTMQASAKDNLVASVDRDQVAINETIELTVEWRGAARTQPDFSALEHQFEVLATRQSSQTSMMGVDVDTVTRWHLTLLPKETGELIIPSFHFEQTISEALAINVTEADPTARAESPFWLESTVDRQTAYPGEQILLTYRLYYAAHLRQMTREDLAIEGAEAAPLQERQFQTVIDGTLFQVAELRFAVFATQPGILEIAPMRISGYSSEGADRRFGGLIRGLGNPVRLSSEAHQIEILPRPTDVTAGYWLPARGVSLSERWSNGDQPLRVGEPVTRTVRIDAQGVRAQQLPELDFGAAENYRIYPEPPQLQHGEDQSGLLASRTESHALIASRPGPLTLPPVKVRWWDSQTQQLRETVLEGRTLEVLPAATVADPEQQTRLTTPPNTEADQPWWPWLSIALNLLLLFALVYVWRTQRGRSAERRISGVTSTVEYSQWQLKRRLKQQVKLNDYQAFRTTLLEWGRQRWPDAAPQTLAEIADLVAQPDLTQLLRELDRVLYSPDTPIAPELGHRILAELKSVDSTDPQREPSSELPPLYP